MQSNNDDVVVAAENSDQSPDLPRYYTAGQIALAAFLGAPLAACWFIGKNKKALGHEQTAKKWVAGGAISTVVLMTAVYFLPETFPHNIIPMAYTLSFYQAAKQIDLKAAQENAELVARKGSWGKVWLVGLGFLVLIIAVVFCVLYLFFPPTQDA